MLGLPTTGQMLLGEKMTQRRGAQLGRWIRWLAILFLTLVVVVVVFQNRETVETKFLFSTIVMPRAALLFVTFSIGAFTGALAFWALRSKSAGKT